MENVSNWLLTNEEKDRLIEELTPELVPLRTKAEISQDELSNLVGISRQTYSAIERKYRKMSWSTYLSLIMFFDYNQKTHSLIRALGVFPHDIIKRFNNGNNPEEIQLSGFIGENMKSVIDSLDEQALLSIRTMIMVEYARCTSTPGEAVVKSFDGVSFTPPLADNITSAKALKTIKERRRQDDKS